MQDSQPQTFRQSHKISNNIQDDYSFARRAQIVTSGHRNEPHQNTGQQCTNYNNSEIKGNLIENRNKVYNCQICNRLRLVCPYTTKNYSLTCFSNTKGSSNSPNAGDRHSSPIKIHDNRQFIQQSIGGDSDYKMPYKKHNKSISTHIEYGNSMQWSPQANPIIEQIIFYPVIHNRYVLVSPTQSHGLKVRDFDDIMQDKCKPQSIYQCEQKPRRKYRGIFNVRSSNIKHNRRISSYQALNRSRDDLKPQRTGNQIYISDFLNSTLPEQSFAPARVIKFAESYAH